MRDGVRGGERGGRTWWPNVVACVEGSQAASDGVVIVVRGELKPNSLTLALTHPPRPTPPHLIFEPRGLQHVSLSVSIVRYLSKLTVQLSTFDGEMTHLGGGAEIGDVEGRGSRVEGRGSRLEVSVCVCMCVRRGDVSVRGVWRYARVRCRSGR